MIRLVQRCREVGTITIVGGLHATLKPEAFTPFANCVVMGEGEVVWPQIIADLEKNCLKPIYNAKAINSFGMRSAPMPAFELLRTGVGRRFTVQTQRGCPWDCEFCAASMRLAPFKMKPIANVVSEIERISGLYGENFVEFADDNTFANRKHSIKLLDALANTNVRFFAESDLSIADDPEPLWRMRDAGCQEVLIGFESSDFNALDGVEQRLNWKAKRVDRALRAVDKIQRTGIAVCGCFVISPDGAGPDSFFQVRDFIERSGVFDVQLTYLTLFPGTPLHTRLTDEGRILSASASERYTLFDINFEPNGMNVEALEHGYRKLMAQLYTDGAVRDRRKRFFGHLRNRIREKRQPNPSLAA
ncbi:MAG: radical SAM protein [Verrucomicrobiales bacterium]